MAYCDFDFYATEYKGYVIAEADFPRLAERASEKLDKFTFERLEDNFPTENEKLNGKVKKTVCAIAELMNDIETATTNSRENGGMSVSSVSSGNESISYSTNSLVGAVITDLTAQNNLFYSIVKDYLSGTGLLYAGF